MHSSLGVDLTRRGIISRHLTSPDHDRTCVYMGTTYHDFITGITSSRIPILPDSTGWGCKKEFCVSSPNMGLGNDWRFGSKLDSLPAQ